jgi:3-oxoacyl-[acyl-carrier protein] reductase
LGKLDGKVALVTGSGRGIGAALAIKLAREGARVVVNDLDVEPAEETAIKIREMGGEAAVCAGSVTADDFAARFVNTALDHFGDLHILVNNAGYTWDANIHNMSDEQYDAMIDVHLKAPWRILREAGRFIRSRAKEEASRGEEVFRKVVNVSSMSGSRGSAGQSNYCSAKAGVIGLTKSLSREWGRFKVNVNSVAFGFIETRLTEVTDDKVEIEVEGRRIGVGVPTAHAKGITSMIPLGRPGTPEEAAGSVLLFCLPDSDYISGQLIEVTGGF